MVKRLKRKTRSNITTVIVREIEIVDIAVVVDTTDRALTRPALAQTPGKGDTRRETIETVEIETGAETYLTGKETTIAIAMATQEATAKTDHPETTTVVEEISGVTTQDALVDSPTAASTARRATSWLAPKCQ
jgi:hypothetical protein